MAAAALPPAGALSARGVPGEAGASPLRELLRKHGGQVPYYDDEGRQHYRVPFKDKSHCADVQERAEWLTKPKHRTRTELFAARRAAQRPDISYDVDGDGAVGPADYFIGKTFGREQDHRLNTGEREQVVQALENGWLDKYSFGHEQAGAKRQMTVRQCRGKIITADTANELTEVYPPHWNAGKTPRHPTVTDLKMLRKTELRQSADMLRDKWEAKNPMSLPEPPIIQEFSVADPPMTHISQRAEVFKSTARQEVGMDPTTSSVNPLRETQEPGLGRREAPECPTRTALQEARRVHLQDELISARVRGEQNFLPVQVTRTMRHHEDYERRRADPEAMTLTKLTERRRQERIEHNMANFTQIPPEPARYSDQDKGWWTMRDHYCPDPPSSLLRELKDVPDKVAPKVTEVEPPRRPPPPDTRPPQAPETPAGFGAAASGSMPGKAAGRRWSTEFRPKGLDANVQRLFDGVRQAPTLATDSLPMHHFSSFEVIRRNGALEEQERQQRVAKEDEDRAEAWQQYVRHGPSTLKAGDTEAASPGVMVVPHRDGLEQRPSVMSDARSRGSVRHQVPRLPLGMATKRLEEPQGEDIPMTERLDLLTGKRSARVEADTPKANNARSSSVMTSGRARPSDSPTTARPVLDRAPSVAPSTTPAPRPTQMVVRSGGFQWLDRHRAAQRLEEPSIGPSRRTPQESMPPSLRRTPQASTRNLGSEGYVSRTQSRLQVDVQSPS